jgi:hypothetical protein|tara:strand:- start:179 stop:421 length:243 start_codon:yes stop_codon:yes gene_type:complete
MTITTATSADWVDFWENEMPTTVEMNQEQITAMLTVSEQIQEQIEIAGELWELSDFEVTALCGIVADAFAEKGIKMEALV